MICVHRSDDRLDKSAIELKLLSATVLCIGQCFRKAREDEIRTVGMTQWRSDLRLRRSNCDLGIRFRVTMRRRRVCRTRRGTVLQTGGAGKDEVHLTNSRARTYRVVDPLKVLPSSSSLGCEGTEPMTVASLRLVSTLEFVWNELAVGGGVRSAVLTSASVASVMACKDLFDWDDPAPLNISAKSAGPIDIRIGGRAGAMKVACDRSSTGEDSDMSSALSVESGAGDSLWPGRSEIKGGD